MQVVLYFFFPRAVKEATSDVLLVVRQARTVTDPTKTRFRQAAACAKDRTWRNLPLGLRDLFGRR
jgi:hypothetical protein